MQSTIPCLVFDEGGEEAVKFYVSVVPNSRIHDLIRGDGKGPIPEGKLLHARFELDGRTYEAFDGGESFHFSEAFSLRVSCDTQEEIDDLWERLTAGGGEPGPCGWLKDRWGVSWQVIPAALGEMLGNPAGGNTRAATEAMLKMGKLEIAELRRAYESAA